MERDFFSLVNLFLPSSRLAVFCLRFWVPHLFRPRSSRITPPNSRSQPHLMLRLSRTKFCDICIRQSPRRYGEMVGPWGMQGALTAWREIRVVFCALRGYLCDGHAPRSFSSPWSATRATRPPIPSRVHKVITESGLVIWDSVLRCTRRLRWVTSHRGNPRPIAGLFRIPSAFFTWVLAFSSFSGSLAPSDTRPRLPWGSAGFFFLFVFFCCFLGLATGGLSALAPEESTRL